MDQYEMIRTSYRVYGKSISELARSTGHSRNTIKKAIRGEPWGYKARDHQPLPVLDQYLPIITGWLATDRDSPKKHRLIRPHRRLCTVFGNSRGRQRPPFP